MRTTVNLDDELLRQARQAAAQSGRTLSDVVSQGLRELLLRRTKPTTQELQLPTMSGQGIRPGLDLDDMGSILDALDEPDAAT